MRLLRRLAGAPVTFNNTSENASLYFWDFGDGSGSVEENPTHAFTGGDLFTIQLIASNGICEDTTERTLTIQDFRLFIPNAFTPNGDNLNDLFFPVHSGVSEMEWRVFGRWGELVFLGGLNSEWDGTLNGKDLPEGVYAVVFQFVLPDGERVRKGYSFTLIR